MLEGWSRRRRALVDDQQLEAAAVRAGDVVAPLHREAVIQAQGHVVAHLDKTSLSVGPAAVSGRLAGGVERLNGSLWEGTKRWGRPAASGCPTNCSPL